MSDRPLHIAIDGRELCGKPTGVGRYLRSVLTEWAGGNYGHRFTIVVPQEPDAAMRALGPAFAWCVEPAEVAGTYWEQTTLARRLARERPDVFFAAGYTAPLRRTCPFVVAIYDVSYFAHPDWFGWREGLRRRWLTRAAARRAFRVVTISEFSRDEIVRFLHTPADRIVLAPPGAPAVAPAHSAAPRPPLVLYVGSLFTRRHVPELMRGFALAAARVPGAQLILVGDNRTSPAVDPQALAVQLGITAQVDWRAYVDDAALDALYGQARAFAFLSDYEGFGMTPMEALAHGVPPVLLDTPIAREVYGDGALRVNLEPAAIADALVRLLTHDAEHAAVLTAGRARLAAYSWSRTAARILRALEEAAS
jgi:glycosyltransferase involved in cell wall biosynthesis